MSSVKFYPILLQIAFEIWCLHLRRYAAPSAAPLSTPALATKFPWIKYRTCAQLELIQSVGAPC